MFENTGHYQVCGHIYSNADGAPLWLSMHISTDAAIAQWGMGAGSAWMVRFAGVQHWHAKHRIRGFVNYIACWSLGIVCLRHIASSCMLVMSSVTVNGKWGEVEGVNPTHEGTVVAGILLACHLYIMFGMQNMYILRSGALSL